MKLDVMRFLLLLPSVDVAQTYFSAQNNDSLAHLWRAVRFECTLGNWGSIWGDHKMVKNEILEF